MADDQGEKTEEPTSKRKRDSREKGQVARSNDLSSSVIMLVAFCILYLFGPWMAGRVIRISQYLFSHMDGIDISHATVNAHAAAGGWTLAATLAPLLAALFVVSFAVTAMQVGFTFTGKPFEFEADKINPIKGFQRLVSIRALMKLVTGLLKMSVVGGVLYLALQAEVPKMLGLIKNLGTTGNPGSLVAVYMAEQALLLGIFASFTLVVLSLLDYFYQRWQHNEDIKMTKQEVKDEMRNMEGDPQIKRRRLEAQRKVAMGRMMQDAKTADVMVTNPTHYTVAIRYSEDDHAPKVVAKGADHLALRLRETARECKIPVVERPELARNLYRWIDVGEYVPEKYWKAVAEVLAFLWGNDEKKRKQLLEEQAQGVK